MSISFSRMTLLHLVSCKNHPTSIPEKLWQRLDFPLHNSARGNCCVGSHVVTSLISFTCSMTLRVSLGVCSLMYTLQGSSVLSLHHVMEHWAILSLSVNTMLSCHICRWTACKLSGGTQWFGKESSSLFGCNYDHETTRNILSVQLFPKQWHQNT